MVDKINKNVEGAINNDVEIERAIAAHTSNNEQIQGLLRHGDPGSKIIAMFNENSADILLYNKIEIENLKKDPNPIVRFDANVFDIDGMLRLSAFNVDTEAAKKEKLEKERYDNYNYNKKKRQEFNQCE